MTRPGDRVEARVPIRVELTGEVYRPLAQFASEHGCTVGDVVERLTRRAVLGSKANPRPLSPKRAAIKERRERIQALYAEGHVVRVIAAQVGVSEATVANDLAFIRRGGAA